MDTPATFSKSCLLYVNMGRPILTECYGRTEQVNNRWSQIRPLIKSSSNNNTHFCRIRDGGGCGGPHPPTIFEGRNLPQQPIYHWKGDLSKSPIHF